MIGNDAYAALQLAHDYRADEIRAAENYRRARLARSAERRERHLHLPRVSALFHVPAWHHAAHH